MNECEHLAGCPFYNDHMDMGDGLGALYKKKYCLGDFPSCARYLVSRRLGRSAVPKDLYPNMRKRADEIIAGKPTS
jgi:hypothetical protein